MIKRLTEPRLILGVYIALAVVVSVHKYSLGDKQLGDRPHTRYNNFQIFKQSASHLLHHQDLYELYSEEHGDYYKYSPTFALLMTPVSYLPDLPGLVLWNLANALALFFALACLPIGPLAVAATQWLVLKDLLTSLQNSQSNALVAATAVLVFAMLERKKAGTAAFYLALSFFIKLYGALIAIVMLLAPRKRAFIGGSAAWCAALALAPLVVISSGELVSQYQSWRRLLASDNAAHYGMSVMGCLHTWFGLEGHKTITLLVGGCLLLLPLARVKHYANPAFRLTYLSSVLIWMVVFNHMAESPTFVIAMCGVAIWYVTCQRTRIDAGLLIFALIFTSLSSTDLFPRPLRNWVVPYQLKAIPCIAIWAKITFDLVFNRIADATVSASSHPFPAPLQAISKAA